MLNDDVTGGRGGSAGINWVLNQSRLGASLVSGSKYAHIAIHQGLYSITLALIQALTAPAPQLTNCFRCLA